MPKVRDGAWGILAALYSFCEPHDQKKFSSRETIVEAGQRYCTASYDANPSTGNKTAWNSGMSVVSKIVAAGHRAEIFFLLTGANLPVIP